MPDPVHTPAPLISADGWNRLALLARALGAIGAVALVGLIVASLWLSHEASRGVSCLDQPLKNVDASAADTGIRIVGLQPAALELNHALCVQVDNVVSPAKQAELLADVTVAAKKVNEAEARSKAILKASSTPAAAAAADAATADAVETKAKADLAAAKTAFAESQKGRTIVLYLNGKASPLTATAQPISDVQTLSFDVAAPYDASSADAAYWRALLAAPANHGMIPLRVGVAELGAPAPQTNLGKVTDAGKKQDVTFLLYTPWLMYGAAAAMFCVLLGLFGLAYDTTLLREGSDNLSAYSLSLVQMAVWLVLTTTGFVYIWIVTGQYQNVFTSGLFVLVGISGATAAAAQALNKSAGTAAKSNGFFYDIVGAWQGGEVQLQRIQIIAWTVILALIFFWNVLSKLTLTSFDANLLVLTGIANGVYVSLKPQEKKP
jgi:hypothetical protein